MSKVLVISIRFEIGVFFEKYFFPMFRIYHVGCSQGNINNSCEGISNIENITCLDFWTHISNEHNFGIVGIVLENKLPVNKYSDEGNVFS